jgi:type III secretory pathway component EscR
MCKFASAMILGMSLLSPVVTLQAQEHRRHEWSASEDPYWHQYLQEHHTKYHDWKKAKKREQEEYWKWREAHHDERR